MRCDRCNSEDRVEEHHLWCKYMDNPHGYSFEGNLSRVNLCWDCHHIKLHKNVILPILKRHSKLLRKGDSEYHLWKFMLEDDKHSTISETVYNTIKFLEEKRDDGFSKL